MSISDLRLEKRNRKYYTQPGTSSSNRPRRTRFLPSKFETDDDEDEADSVPLKRKKKAPGQKTATDKKTRKNNEVSFVSDV